MQRACGIAVCRIAPLAMETARRAQNLFLALDANANGTRMRNRVVVYVRVCIICTCAYVALLWGCAGAAAGMQRLCGAYSVAVGIMAQELVVACGACARAL